MFRQAIHSLRMFLVFFQDIPPLPRHALLPAAALAVAYPALSVLLGPGEAGQAFVTAFLLALALRVALRFENVLRQLLGQFSRRETAAMALLVTLTPLVLLASVDDPLWCQRSLSAYYIVVGSMFVSDMLAGRDDMARRFWPWQQMAEHLPAMTRAMVLYNLGFLILNETMIRTVAPTQWLVYWALVPALAHLVLSAVILTIVHLDPKDDARG
jgi:hypothetical protein